MLSNFAQHECAAVKRLNQIGAFCLRVFNEERELCENLSKPSEASLSAMEALDICLDLLLRVITTQQQVFATSKGDYPSFQQVLVDENALVWSLGVVEFVDECFRSDQLQDCYSAVSNGLEQLVVSCYQLVAFLCQQCTTSTCQVGLIATSQTSKLPKSSEKALMRVDNLRILLDLAVQRCGHTDRPEHEDALFVSAIHALFWMSTLMGHGVENLVVQCLLKPTCSQPSSSQNTKESPSYVCLGIAMIKTLNRAQDPFTKEPCLRLFDELFSSKPTASFFYANDVFVLVDILMREVANSDAQDPLITWVLSVLYGIITNCTHYTSEMYKLSQLKQTVVARMSSGDQEKLDVIAYGLCQDISQAIDSLEILIK